jgi:hypothetical protein
LYGVLHRLCDFLEHGFLPAIEVINEVRCVLFQRLVECRELGATAAFAYKIFVKLIEF